MCLVSEQKVPKVAKRNIYCYKTVYKIDSNTYRSYIEGFQYLIGETYSAALSIAPFKMFDSFTDTRAINRFINKHDNGVELFTVSEGFHSYSTIKRIVSFFDFFNLCVVLCMIPKGSEYIKDGDGLIVSNQIIILSEIGSVEKIFKP